MSSDTSNIGLLGMLIERWRDRASSQGAIYASAILECADELEAALATLPLHQWGDECVNDARVCQRCGARWVVGHEPEGPCVALPTAPPPIDRDRRLANVHKALNRMEDRIARDRVRGMDLSDCQIIRSYVQELEREIPPAPLQGQEPQLAWSRDEDGDYLVTLTGMPNYYLTTDGKTVEEALHRLGDALEGCFMDACTDPDAHKAASPPAQEQER